MVAVITSLRGAYRATLVDLSVTGARLCCDDPPELGEELLISVETLRVFGQVAWSSNGEFGVAFDPPLHAGQVEMLFRQGARARGLSADMKLALDVWMGGSAR